MAEQTLVIVKPDAIQRHFAGEILSRFERKGLKLVAAKFVQISESLAQKLYSEHKGEPFFEGLAEHLSSSPCMLMVWEAEGVIDMVRKMLGDTFGHDAQPGTIRGDFNCSTGFNLVHGSDSKESAEKEISLFFEPEEIVDYEFTHSHWLYGKHD